MHEGQEQLQGPWDRCEDQGSARNKGWLQGPETLEGARNSQEGVEGTQGAHNKGAPGPAPGSGGEQPKFPVPVPAPQGHWRLSSSSLGKRRMAEAFPWAEERLLGLWIPVFRSMRSSQGEPPAVPSVQKHQTHPTQGIPTAFPEFLQSSAKLPLSISITGERIYPRFHLSKELEGIKNRREGSALQNSPESRERGKSLSSHLQNTKIQLHGNIPLLGEVRTTMEYQEFCTNPGGSWDTTKPFLDEVREVQVSKATGEEPNCSFSTCPKVQPQTHLEHSWVCWNFPPQRENPGSEIPLSAQAQEHS